MIERTISPEMTCPLGLATRRIAFSYRNWRGEFARREAEPIAIWYGSTPFHPEMQWLMRATDLAKGEVRDFAMRDMCEVHYGEGEAADA